MHTEAEIDTCQSIPDLVLELTLRIHSAQGSDVNNQAHLGYYLQAGLNIPSPHNCWSHKLDRVTSGRIVKVR